MTGATLTSFALSAAALCLSAAPMAAPPQRASRPKNLIVIIADEWCVDSMEGPAWPNEFGCFTPVLGRLARLGVSFTNFRPQPLDAAEGEAPGRGGSAEFEPYQRAIVPLLVEQGYYVVEVDSADLGPARAGLRAPRFGPVFDEGHHEPPRLVIDDPLEVGDEAMASAVLVALHRVMYRAPEEAGKPYALFFRLTAPRFVDEHGAAIDPAGGDGYRWPRVDPFLCRVTWNRYGSTFEVGPRASGGDAIRFHRYTEARDSVIGRLVGHLGLGVIDEFTGDYGHTSEAVVCMLSTSPFDRRVFVTLPEEVEHEVEASGSTPALPLFFAGEGIAGATRMATSEDRRVVLADVAATLSDIAAIPLERRVALDSGPGGAGRSLAAVLGLVDAKPEVSPDRVEE
ncbi:MAG: hypothetical protein KJZ69_06815 [Phycisphaerales bacterium]|nr:hypothetical protein [Phycisphaerales bacterium]